MQQHVYPRPHQLVRSKTALAHDRIHVAVDEVYVRKAFPQPRVYHVKIHAGKMVDAAGVQKYGRRAIRKLADDICRSFYDQFFHVAVEEIVLADSNCGKSVHEPHLSSCKNYAAQAARSADIYLMRFRHQHSGMHDIPRAARR